MYMYVTAWNVHVYKQGAPWYKQNGGKLISVLVHVGVIYCKTAFKTAGVYCIVYTCIQSMDPFWQ